MIFYYGVLDKENGGFKVEFLGVNPYLAAELEEHVDLKFSSFLQEGCLCLILHAVVCWIS